MLSLKKLTTATFIGLSLLGSSFVSAEMFEVTITNGTAGQVITPPVIITHNHNVSLFRLGESAPDYLVALAEDGDASGLSGVDSHPDVSAITFSDGPVLPGHSVTLTIETTEAYPLLSVAGMFASSNDAFISVNGEALDFNTNSSKYLANVYDAGTEFNSESCDFIPGPPCGNGGVRNPENAEGFVTLHSGLHGVGDLDVTTLSWSNPGAIITVKQIAQ